MSRFSKNSAMVLMMLFSSLGQSAGAAFAEQNSLPVPQGEAQFVCFQVGRMRIAVSSFGSTGEGTTDEENLFTVGVRGLSNFNRAEKNEDIILDAGVVQFETESDLVWQESAVRTRGFYTLTVRSISQAASMASGLIVGQTLNPWCLKIQKIAPGDRIPSAR